MPRRNRIPIEHRERIVRAFEDEAEDYLLVTDTLGVNRSTARGIVARYRRAYRRFSRYVMAAMLVDENKRFLISSFCLSTSNCTLQHCYLCP